MTRAALVAATLSLLAIVPAARADRYLSGRQAESFARDAARKEYDAPSPSAGCRPHGPRVSPRGHRYHRWLCGWADTFWYEDGTSDVCRGRLVISGSRERRRSYRHRVREGIRCVRTGRTSGARPGARSAAAPTTPGAANLVPGDAGISAVQVTTLVRSAP